LLLGLLLDNARSGIGVFVPRIRVLTCASHLNIAWYHLRKRSGDNEMADRTVLDLYRHEVDAPRPEHYAHWTPTGRRVLTTQEFFSKTCALAEAWVELGVARGDRVVLLSDNRPEWHMVDLATLDVSAVDVPVYQTLTPTQLAYQVEDSGAVAAVAENSTQMAKFLDIRKRCPNLRHLVQIDGDRAEGVLDFDQLVAAVGGDSEGRFWSRGGDIEEGDLATIIYTSGTTGEPKGVMLSHRNLVQNTTFTNRRLKGSRSDLALEFLPLCHTAERIAGYCYMQRAMSKAYCTVEHVGGLLAKIAPTVFFAAPRVYEKLYQTVIEKVESAQPIARKLFFWSLGVGCQANDCRIGGNDPGTLLTLKHRLADRLVLSKIRDNLGGRVRLCITGAAELPPYVDDFFHALGVPMVDAYGLTETAPVAVIGSTEPAEVRRGWIGRPLDNLEVKLAEDGEVLVRGPSVMMGYWNKPEQTAETIDSDGFLRTGDIGEMDSDGYLRIIDRKKDLIVTSGGKNVAPQPIESRLKQSQMVDVAVLIGERRNFISALITPDFEQLGQWAEEHDVTRDAVEDLLRTPEVLELFQQVVDGVNAELARYEQIRKFRLLPVPLTVEDGSLTPTLKVRRRVVTERFADIIEGIYSTGAR
jgi:long-chain acyl-CoA synthetase